MARSIKEQLKAFAHKYPNSLELHLTSAEASQAEQGISTSISIYICVVEKNSDVGILIYMNIIPLL